MFTILRRTQQQPPALIQKETQTALPAVRQCAAVVSSEPVKETQLTVPAETRSLALERLRFVQLVKSVKLQHGKTENDAVHFVAMNHALEFPLLCKAGKKGSSALSYPNYRKWQERIRNAPEGGELDALCDNYCRGIRERAGSERFWKLAMGFYLNQNKLDATRAYKLACEKLRDEKPDAQVASFAQFRYRIAQLDPKVVMLAREGEEALKNKYIGWMERDWSEYVPGEIIVCDSRKFDTRVKVWDDEAQKWRAVRPTITGMMDARSWYLASWWITTESVNHETLINTLALYLYNNGNVPPAVAYTDNGSDYCAAGFSKDFDADGHKHSIFRELGISLITAIPYNARAKTIERLFRDMMTQYDKMFSDYLGSRPGQRTQSADYYDTHAEELPSEHEFAKMFYHWLEEFHNTPKNGKIHKGKSPAEIWASRPAKPPVPDSVLKMAFLKPEDIRVVGRGPRVTIANKFYYSDELFKRIGDRVMIKTDRLNKEHVYAFNLDGSLICECRTREAIKALALDDPEARKRIGEGLAQQRREIKSVYTLLAAETGNFHKVSPAELFLAEPDAELVKIGEKASVKGASHRYEHMRLVSENTPPKEEERPAVEIEFKEDIKEEKLAAFGAAVMPAAEEEKANPAEMSAFHDFITTKKKEDDYE